MSWPSAASARSRAAIIGGGAVPVGRQQARTVEGDVHLAASRAEAPRRARRGRPARSPAVRPPGARRYGAGGWSAGRCRERAREVPIAQHRGKLPGHRLAVARDQEVLAAEQPLLVVPGRADQRNAAGERLEHADRGDAGKRRDIGTPWHVDGDAVMGEHLPAPRHWRSSRRSAGGARQRGARRIRIAHAAHRAARLQPPCRLDQELAQFLRALAVAPVADPDQVVGLLRGAGAGGTAACPPPRAR